MSLSNFLIRQSLLHGFTGKKLQIMLLLYSVLFINTIHAQTTITVNGVITSQSGEPLAGVSIARKGGQEATVSKDNGNFQISVAPGSTLLFSYVGYAAKEIKVGAAGTNLSIQMLTNKNELNQVVVVGYGTRKKIRCNGFYQFRK